MHVDEKERIIGFVEKPKDPPTIPGNPTLSLASMGIYVFNTDYLLKLLAEDAANKTSSHDFGKDIIPWIVKHGKAIAHRFAKSCVRSNLEREPYWRDVGRVDAYWEANIDLCDTLPSLDLYSKEWPIWTYSEVSPPAKFVHDDNTRRGSAVSSLVSGGCIVSGGSVRRSLLFTGVHVHSYTKVEEAVIMPDVDIGQHSRLSKVVIDRGVRIPAGLVVGDDPVLDAKRFRRTDSGICLITQPMIDALSVK
jgi:glucose-1-phosphate adenylyltransferase